MASIVDTRPATAAATVSALPTAIASILIGLNWWNPSDAELVAVTGAMAVIIGILGKFVASVVYCRATVKDLLGPTPDQAAHVAPESSAVTPPLPPAPTPPAPASGPPGDVVLGGTPERLEEYMRRHPDGGVGVPKL